MQVLTNFGNEFEKTKGLGWIGGDVIKLTTNEAKIPHIGWNSLNVKKNNKLFNDNCQNRDFYFVHSYAVNGVDKSIVTSNTFYENSFISSINKDNIYGVQFHPEKSQTAGLKLFKNFFDKC